MAFEIADIARSRGKIAISAKNLPKNAKILKILDLALCAICLSFQKSI